MYSTHDRVVSCMEGIHLFLSFRSPLPSCRAPRRHSWFKNKILSYSVTLHVPSLLATERAKCIRAVNALGACVRDRDDSAARAAAAAEEGKETDANVEVFNEKIHHAVQLARDRIRDTEVVCRIAVLSHVTSSYRSLRGLRCEELILSFCSILCGYGRRVDFEENHLPEKNHASSLQCCTGIFDKDELFLFEFEKIRTK